MAYIDKDELYEAITDLPFTEGCAVYDSYDVENTIRNFPEADVQEVKHGKWKEHFDFGVWHYDCPFCDDGYATKEKDKILPNYCQNCGAKMDLESD